MEKMEKNDIFEVLLLVVLIFVAIFILHLMIRELREYGKNQIV